MATPAEGIDDMVQLVVDQTACTRPRAKMALELAVANGNQHPVVEAIIRVSKTEWDGQAEHFCDRCCHYKPVTHLFERIKKRLCDDCFVSGPGCTACADLCPGETHASYCSQYCWNIAKGYKPAVVDGVTYWSR